MSSTPNDVAEAGPLPEALENIRKGNLDLELAALTKSTRSSSFYDMGMDDGMVPNMELLNNNPILQTSQLGLSVDNRRDLNNPSAIFGSVPDFGSPNSAPTNPQSATGLTPLKKQHRQVAVGRGRASLKDQKPLASDRTTLRPGSSRPTGKQKFSNELSAGCSEYVSDRSDSSLSGDYPRDDEVPNSVLRTKMMEEFQEALTRAHPGSILKLIDGRMVIETIKEDIMSSMGTQPTISLAQTPEGRTQKHTSWNPEVKKSESQATLCPTWSPPGDVWVSVKSIIKNKLIRVNLTDFVQIEEDLDNLLVPFKRYLKPKNLISKAHIIYDLGTLRLYKE